MNVSAVQAALTAHGYACAVDGACGPQTYGALLSYAAGRHIAPLDQALGLGMIDAFPARGIASDLQIIHWIAQSCHETEGYRRLTEVGSATYFSRYDGRSELGNTEPGDGFRFRGRGLFQITGRWNYRHYGGEIGEPLETDPDLAAQPPIAVRIACQFWIEHRIGPLADADDVEAVTRKINGGLNGLADRQAITDKLKSLFALA